MKHFIKNRLWLFGLLAASTLVYISQNGIYPRYFDIEWDEEVELHDGRVIVVNIKRTFERRSAFNRWRGIHRDTEISFDAGGKIGKFSKKLQRYDISFLHNKDNSWYMALGITTGTPPVELITQEKSLLILHGDGAESKIDKSDLPREFRVFNIMPLTPSPSGVAKFDGKKLSIARKMEHWQANPRAAGDGPNMQIHLSK